MVSSSPVRLCCESHFLLCAEKTLTSGREDKGNDSESVTLLFINTSYFSHCYKVLIMEYQNRNQ